MVDSAPTPLNSHIDADRHGQSIIIPQLFPTVIRNAAREELVVIMTRYCRLMPPSFVDIPIEHQRIGQVIRTQPDSQAPVERLAVDEVDRFPRVTGNQNIVLVWITMDQGEAVVVARAVDHRRWMKPQNFIDCRRPMGFQFARKLAKDMTGTRPRHLNETGDLFFGRQAIAEFTEPTCPPAVSVETGESLSQV